MDVIKRLAKALKKSKMAKTNDEAMKMAEKMVDRGEKRIKKLIKKQSKGEKE